MSRTLIVVIHVIAFLIGGVETLYLASWHQVPVQVTTAELYHCPADDDLDGVAICAHVLYAYEFQGVSYESAYLRPIFNTADKELFWRAFDAKRLGKPILGFVSPQFPHQSALERFPGQMSMLLVWLLIGFHLLYWSGRMLARKFVADGPEYRHGTLRVVVFLVGTLAVMLSPLLEKALLPWKEEKVKVLSMTPTPGPTEFCMTVVLSRVDVHAVPANQRVKRICNAGALFQLSMHMQMRKAFTIYVRNADDLEIVRLGPRATSDGFRWAVWYALFFVFLI